MAVVSYMCTTCGKNPRFGNDHHSVHISKISATTLDFCSYRFPLTASSAPWVSQFNWLQGSHFRGALLSASGAHMGSRNRKTESIHRWHGVYYADGGIKVALQRRWTTRVRKCPHMEKHPENFCGHLRRGSLLAKTDSKRFVQVNKVGCGRDVEANLSAQKLNEEMHGDEIDLRSEKSLLVESKKEAGKFKHDSYRLSREVSSDSAQKEEQSQSKTVARYGKEMEVAVKAVQLACMLSQVIQDRLLRNEEKANAKMDNSLVTVADWGVQAVVSWILSQAFEGEEVTMVAEEDTSGLRGMDGVHVLQRVVNAVNECLNEAWIVGIQPPRCPLGTIDVLKAINKGIAKGGQKGRYWVLDPVDGTLGFVRGDQYAIALAMIDNGEVVLAVLGCPNFPMRKEWLNHHHRYYRLVSRLIPPHPGLWHKGLVLTATKGEGQASMQPLLVNDAGVKLVDRTGYGARAINVSLIDDPSLATFCEPVEKANSSHSFTAGLAHSLGLRNHPLRVYSMAKYAAIARGDAEIFMKFGRAGYKEKVWDHAAGVLIVQEAGGVVTDAGGRPLDFSKGRYLEGLDRGIIASSGSKLHEKILAAVDASWEASTL